MKKLTRLFAAAAISVLALGATATPAFAEDASTRTVFDGTTADAEFGAPWLLEIRVSNAEFPTPVEASNGTVSIFLDGSTEPYVEDLPIALGGYAYFAQPADQPTLVAGEHTVTATFVPAGGSELAASTTRNAATITITPLGVTSSIAVVADPARYPVPTIEATLGGAYTKLYDRAPAGEWTAVVTAEDGSEVFTATAAQAGSLEEPTALPITSGLEPGKNYTVSATFVPDEAIAGGVSVGEAAPATFESAPAGAFDGAVQPVFLPVWALILAGLLFLAAAAAFVFVLLRTRAPARAPGKRVAVATPVAPAAPAEDFGDLDSIDDMFTPTQHFEAIRLTEMPTADAPTELLRTSAADVPTQLIGTSDSADQPTELIDTTDEDETPRSDGGSSWSINGGS
ncbi:hypothetical protein EYE40_03805 [Glaciihabitans arcticus]|uniref:Ig-like domain repeat protein n=1 Tax=Glaciihabitans arcticus TaxID=2668039 RepID=A0A4Q9GP41_9MICO|nr:hypothetical protein [Glaciihabitans arcticus]TBN56592.1 hypothetical protein EYE40_03805 [Glaciihabitans arcticus]